MFQVKAGTKARVIEVGKEWMAPNFQDITTTRDSIFDKHEVAVDPVGKLGTHRGFVKTIGGAFAKTGYYAFRPMEGEPGHGWILIVHDNDVTYLD